MEIIFKAFKEESFSFKGQHYTIPPPVPYRGYELKEITLVPRPVHLPVEVWQPVVSGSPRGLDFMAKHGIKGILSRVAEQFTWQWAHDFQDAAARYGRQLRLGQDLILRYRTYIDDTLEKAVHNARPYFEEHVKFAAPLGMLRYGEE